MISSYCRECIKQHESLQNVIKPYSQKMKTFLIVLASCLVASAQVQLTDYEALEKFESNFSEPSFLGLLLGPNLDLSALLKEAIRLQNAADEMRHFAIKLYKPGVAIAPSVGARLLKMAQVAFICPTLIESKVFVPQWAKWWSEWNDSVPFDTRLDADRFIAYVLSRLHHRIFGSEHVLEFEERLDQQYQKVISSLDYGCATYTSPAELEMSSTTVEESPTPVLSIYLV